MTKTVLKILPVGNHSGCGLVERSIQTIERRLGASRLNPDFSSVHERLRHIIEDIRVFKNSVTRFSPFELHVVRPTNTELSLAAERLPSRVNLDNHHLERDLFTAEQRREQCDSRPRIKYVKKRSIQPISVAIFWGANRLSRRNSPLPSFGKFGKVSQSMVDLKEKFETRGRRQNSQDSNGA